MHSLTALLIDLKNAWAVVLCVSFLAKGERWKMPGLKQCCEWSENKEFIWVGSTEPKANLSKSNNGLRGEQRGTGLWPQCSTSPNTNSSEHGAFVPPPQPLSCPSSRVTMQVLVWLWQVQSAPFTFRMSVVYKKKWPNGGRLPPPRLWWDKITISDNKCVPLLWDGVYPLFTRLLRTPHPS